MNSAHLDALQVKSSLHQTPKPIMEIRVNYRRNSNFSVKIADVSTTICIIQDLT